MRLKIIPAIVCVGTATTIIAEPPQMTPPRWTNVGCWFWTEAEFAPDGYKQFLDTHAAEAGFDLLTTSIRHPVEVTDPAVHDQLAAAAHYANERGIDIALDLDVRLARAAFQAKYPDEMQEILRLQEAPMAENGAVRIRTDSLGFGDHYTFKARPYECIASRLVRVYSYMGGEGGIDPASAEDITSRCRVEEAATEGVTVVIPCTPADAGRTACAMSAFTVFTPDVFAPHLLEFERATLEQYADVPLAGACKDEWGFPGRFEISTNDLWFSRFMADAYAARRPGRELIYDLLLMSKGMRGRDGERAAAINHYMEMLRERNEVIEGHFYESVKAVFEDAYVGTHPTWFPYPGEQEAFKNGLSWWGSRRDWGQTDETTPYCARTSLAKKWGSATWLNMYYAPTSESYADDIWRHALGGGRMNHHPRYPVPVEDISRQALDADLVVARRRIQMLDFISTAPVDCPVAVVFGHPSYLNFAGAGFADAGVKLADALWEKGIYADLISTSEVRSGALQVSAEGRLTYGPQEYEAAVLYHPEYERPEVVRFFEKLAERGKTALYQVGSWTTTFEGEIVSDKSNDQSGQSDKSDRSDRSDPVHKLDAAACVQAIEQHVREAGIALQTPCELRTLHGFPDSMVPRRSGVFRLLDGTHIVISGNDAAKGDAISQISVGNQQIAVDAIGVAAARVNSAGQVEALACGGLKRFHGGGLDIELDDRVDVALWRTAGGAWHGAIAGTATVPDALAALTMNWRIIGAIDTR